MDNKEIGAILKQARERAGIPREMIADMVGRSVKTVGHWETGYTAIDATTLFALCKIYDIDMDNAFGFDRANSKGIDSFKTRFISALSDLDTDNWTVLEKVFDSIYRDK